MKNPIKKRYGKKFLDEFFNFRVIVLAVSSLLFGMIVGYLIEKIM